MPRIIYIIFGVSVSLQVAMNVYELSSAAGLPCEIDPALVVALSSQKTGKHTHTPRQKLTEPCGLSLTVVPDGCARREHQSRRGVQDRVSADGVCGRFLADAGQQRHVAVQPRHRRYTQTANILCMLTGADASP